jgi:hypothetical protein
MHILPLLVSLVGCAYEETALEHVDIAGTVKIPKEALNIEVIDNDDNVYIIEGDIRTLGPVYLGVFPGVQEGAYAYTSPETGPVLSATEDGDTYPYGGTTVGRMEFGCYEQLVCKMVTGRFTSFDDVLDFHANVLHEPILNQQGLPVGSAEEYRETCYDVNNYATDFEVDFIKEGRLDFKEDGDYLVADVEILHTYFKEGMSIWGWVDMPSRTFDFSTCDAGQGTPVNFYDQQYTRGANYSNLLNQPGKYIQGGDWVADEIPTIESADDKFEVVLGFKNE